MTESFSHSLSHWEKDAGLKADILHIDTCLHKWILSRWEKSATLIIVARIYILRFKVGGWTGFTSLMSYEHVREWAGGIISNSLHM